MIDNSEDLNSYPNNNYKKFFDKFLEIETLDISAWGTTHVLAYFCKKYKEQYQTAYIFKFNTPAPSKCFEVFQIKRLSMVLSSKPSILKKYIDWVFENKVIKAKRKLTSVSFLNNEQSVVEYKTLLLASAGQATVSRSTDLPLNYQSILQEVGLFASTYGDLAFLAQMDETLESKQAFAKLSNLGFDKEILVKII